MRSRQKRIERLRKRIQKYRAELLKLEMEELGDTQPTITISDRYKYDGVLKTELEESCKKFKEPVRSYFGTTVDNSIDLSGFYHLSYPVTFDISGSITV